MHAFRIDWITGVEGLTALCDGVAECQRAVRLQLRVGARVIKVCASGGVMSELDDPIHQRFIIDELLGMEDQLPPYAWRKAAAFADRHREAVEIAVEQGVQIAVGCDIFTSGELHGRNGLELAYLVMAGMDPLAAVEAATANGPATLGPQAPLSGQLVAGYDADVIALADNPLEDIGILADAVTHVWQARRLAKQAQ